jgi:hypothetical protein
MSGWIEALGTVGAVAVAIVALIVAIKTRRDSFRSANASERSAGAAEDSAGSITPFRRRFGRLDGVSPARREGSRGDRSDGPRHTSP